MRSLLIAPADEKRLAEALASGADAVVVDLALRRGRREGCSAGHGGRFPQSRPRPPRRPGARRRGQRAGFQAKPTPTSTRSWAMRPTPSCCPAASERRASSSSRPSLQCGRRISTSRTRRRKSSPSSTLRGRYWAWPAIASQAGGSPGSPGAPPGCAPMSAPRATATMTAPTPPPFAWRATLPSWPRPPQGWRRLTPRSPTSPTSQACVRKRSPPGATDSQPSSRSARSRRAS